MAEVKKAESADVAAQRGMNYAFTQEIAAVLEKRLPGVTIVVDKPAKGTMKIVLRATDQATGGVNEFSVYDVVLDNDKSTFLAAIHHRLFPSDFDAYDILARKFKYSATLQGMCAYVCACMGVLAVAE